jgi:hypothetical protein
MLRVRFFWFMVLDAKEGSRNCLGTVAGFFALGIFWFPER